jgi:chloramphenicol O-acetyltransferase type A
MAIKLINIETWKRKNHFNFYKDFYDPYFNVCCQIDVTKVAEYSKIKNISLFFTLLYLSSKACNQVKAFRLRLTEDKQVIEYQKVNPSATLLNDDETFTFCDFEFQDNLKQFVSHAEQARIEALQQESLTKISNTAEQVFYSILPWLSFTSYKHANSSTGVGNPKIVFGKITRQASRSFMPISVELHHALADGIDIAKYIQCFETNIKDLKF